MSEPTDVTRQVNKLPVNVEWSSGCLYRTSNCARFGVCAVCAGEVTVRGLGFVQFAGTPAVCVDSGGTAVRSQFKGSESTNFKILILLDP